MNNYSPIGFRMMPPVVKNLLIINLLMFFGSMIAESKFGFDLTQYLGLFYPASTYFQPYQLISHMFMHGGFSHIFFNMFALWMFGTALENVWGAKRFLFFYLFTGLGAAGLHLLVSWWRITDMHTAIIAYQNTPSPQAFAKLVSDHFPEFQGAVSDFVYSWSKNLRDPHFIQETNSFIQTQVEMRMNIPTVGASGAVFGLLVGFGMLFPNTELFLMFIPIPIKAKYAVILYGVVELFLGVAQFSGDNIAHFAHLGGALFGFVLVIYWKKNQFKRIN